MITHIAQWSHGLNLKKNFLLIAVSLVIVSLVAIGLLIAVEPLGRGDATGDNASSYVPPAPLFPRASDFGKHLGESREPKVIAVLGDSTGNEKSEWVYRFAETISSIYDRPVTVHDWSVPSRSYFAASTIGDGVNAPVEIWNGSASGADASYSLANLTDLVPVTPDLILINHGHNFVSPDAAVQGGLDLLSRFRVTWPGSRPIIATILQNPRSDATSINQSAKVEAARLKFSNRADVHVIDVWGAFSSAPDLKVLLREDGFNPNDAGGRVWAEVVLRSLGIEET